MAEPVVIIEYVEVSIAHIEIYLMLVIAFVIYFIITDKAAHSTTKEALTGVACLMSKVNQVYLDEYGKTFAEVWQCDEKEKSHLLYALKLAQKFPELCERPIMRLPEAPTRDICSPDGANEANNDSENCTSQPCARARDEFWSQDAFTQSSPSPQSDNSDPPATDFQEENDVGAGGVDEATGEKTQVGETGPAKEVGDSGKDASLGETRVTAECPAEGTSLPVQGNTTEPWKRRRKRKKKAI